MGSASVPPKAALTVGASNVNYDPSIKRARSGHDIGYTVIIPAIYVLLSKYASLLFNECACFSSGATFLWHSSEQTSNQPTCVRPSASVAPPAAAAAELSSLLHAMCVFSSFFLAGPEREGEGVYPSPPSPADVPNANLALATDYDRKRKVSTTQPRSEITMCIDRGEKVSVVRQLWGFLRR